MSQIYKRITGDVRLYERKIYNDRIARYVIMVGDKLYAECHTIGDAYREYNKA